MMAHASNASNPHPSTYIMDAPAASRVGEACTFCRKRKVKCVFKPGALHCQQCELRNKLCVTEKKRSDNLNFAQAPRDPADELVAKAMESVKSSLITPQQATQRSTEALNEKIISLSEELNNYKQMSSYWQNQHLSAVPENLRRLEQARNTQTSTSQPNYNSGMDHSRSLERSSSSISSPGSYSTTSQSPTSPPGAQIVVAASSTSSQLQGQYAPQYTTHLMHSGLESHAPTCAHNLAGTVPVEHQLVGSSLVPGIPDEWDGLELGFHLRVLLPQAVVPDGPPKDIFPLGTWEDELPLHSKELFGEFAPAQLPAFAIPPPCPTVNLKGQIVSYRSHDLMEHVTEYYLDVVALQCSYYQHPIVDAPNAELLWKSLSKPLHIEDSRTPDDIYDASPDAMIVRPEDAPVEVLLSLWEHALMWMYGSAVANLPGLTGIFASNAERLMFSIIFQRQIQGMPQHTARIINSLSMMTCHYRGTGKLGASYSLVVLAHQIASAHLSLIAPVVADRVHVGYLLSATTEAERLERLKLIQAQQSITSSLMVPFLSTFVITKMRTTPNLPTEDLEEMLTLLTQIDTCLTVPPASTQPSRVWFKAIVLVLRAELAARTEDTASAQYCLEAVMRHIELHYTPALIFLLAVELQNFITDSQLTAKAPMVVAHKLISGLQDLTSRECGADAVLPGHVALY